MMVNAPMESLMVTHEVSHPHVEYVCIAAPGATSSCRSFMGSSKGAGIDLPNPRRIGQVYICPIKAINITGWRVRAVLSRRKMDVGLESGFLTLDRESSMNRTACKWPLFGDLGALVRAQVAQIALEERKLRRVIA